MACLEKIQQWIFKDLCFSFLCKIQYRRISANSSLQCYSKVVKWRWGVVFFFYPIPIHSRRNASHSHRKSDKSQSVLKEFWPIPVPPTKVLTNPSHFHTNSEQSFRTIELSTNPSPSHRKSDQSQLLPKEFWPILSTPTLSKFEQFSILLQNFWPILSFLGYSWRKSKMSLPQFFFPPFPLDPTETVTHSRRNSDQYHSLL